MLNKLLFAGLLIIALAACKQTEELTPQPAQPSAGPGGNAILRIIPKHHTWLIDSCAIYIKYNSADLPATFDDTVWAIKASPGDTAIATFSGLKTGQYYLYGYGWDPQIMDTVVGGLPYYISSEAVHTTDLYVTEGD